MRSLSPLALLPLLLPLVTSSRSNSTAVQIRNGTLIGTVDPASLVQKFLGVPFAEPPIGALRLQQAVALRNSFGVLEADRFGPACYNAGNAGNASEDCLTLNIWRPLGSAMGERLPVLVWLYGGGLTAGYTVRRHLLGRDFD